MKRTVRIDMTWYVEAEGKNEDEVLDNAWDKMIEDDPWNSYEDCDFDICDWDYDDEEEPEEYEEDKEGWEGWDEEI